MRFDVTALVRVQETIHRIFREQMNVEVPSADTDLFQSGALDSLTLVDLLVRLEEETGRRISLEELEISSFRSIAAIAELLLRDQRTAG